MKITRLLLAVGGIASLCGCAHTHRSPDLTARPAPVQQPPKPKTKGVLQRTGDAAWDVVSAPVRLIAPGKKPAPKKEEPEVYEPADAMIMLPPDAAAAAAPPPAPGSTTQQ